MSSGVLTVSSASVTPTYYDYAPTTACYNWINRSLPGWSNGTNCTTVASPVAGMANDTVVTRTAGDNFTFTTMNQPGTNLKLCYKFGAEPWRLYPAFTMEVLKLVNFTASVPGENDDVIVADLPKTFNLGGNGMRGGDRLKLVDPATASDEACGANGTNAEGLLAGSNVQHGQLVVPGPHGNTTGPMTVRIRSTAQSPYRICYTFGDEPYKLYADLRLAKKVIAVTATARPKPTPQWPR